MEHNGIEKNLKATSYSDMLFPDSMTADSDRTSCYFVLAGNFIINYINMCQQII
jgi:hypothetical protein